MHVCMHTQTHTHANAAQHSTIRCTKTQCPRVQYVTVQNNTLLGNSARPHMHTNVTYMLTWLIVRLHACLQNEASMQKDMQTRSRAHVHNRRGEISLCSCDSCGSAFRACSEHAWRMQLPRQCGGSWASSLKIEAHGLRMLAVYVQDIMMYHTVYI